MFPGVRSDVFVWINCDSEKFIPSDVKVVLWSKHSHLCKIITLFYTNLTEKCKERKEHTDTDLCALYLHFSVKFVQINVGSVEVTILCNQSDESAIFFLISQNGAKSVLNTILEHLSLH